MFLARTYGLVALLLSIDVLAQRPVNSHQLDNQAAFIPPQCYVKTEVEGKIYNTCYTCHTDSKSPNFMNDADTQLEYGFNKYARRNRWENLFIDRSDEISKISDDEIQAYVSSSNYIVNGELLLATKLKQLPKEWDADGNQKWDGYMPDSYFNFDAEGFDRSPSGSYTGWRSYVYVPFPGSFVPAAGSAGDALIRLPKAFQLDREGKFSIATYKLNLSIVEALIKQEDLPITSIDEQHYGVDLDLNGTLNHTQLIRFKSNAVDGSGMQYVGLASVLHEEGKIKLAAGLYPVGTEFLHSVRYLDIQDGQVTMSKRMKELRYAKKIGWASVPFQEQFAVAEAQERALFPEQIPIVQGNHEAGVLNGLGWRFQGFIEGSFGELRPQNYEEQVFCIGCHSAIGALHDSTFSFARKNNGYYKGWTSWQDASINSIFSDESVKRKFQDYFITAGSVTDYSQKTMPESLNMSLLIPNKDQAFELNKAYKVIVEEQSFKKGRDATVLPMGQSVHRVIRAGQKTGIKSEVLSPF